jgi:hypothetical protein
MFIPDPGVKKAPDPSLAAAPLFMVQFCTLNIGLSLFVPSLICLARSNPERLGSDDPENRNKKPDFMCFFSGHAAPYPWGAQKTARGHLEEKQIIQQTHSEESNPGDMPRNTVQLYIFIQCYGSGSGSRPRFLGQRKHFFGPKTAVIYSMSS